MRTEFQQNAWKLAFPLVVALTGAHALSGGNRYGPSAVYLTAALGGTATLLWTVHRRRLRAGWKLIAVGFAAWVCGDVAWDLHDVFGVAAVPVSLENVLYLAIYPFLIAGLIMLLLARRESVETIVRQLIDAALLFVSGFAALWIFYGDDIAREHSVLSIVYPTLDLVVFALVARFVFGSGRWSGASRLLAVALPLMLAGDLAWQLQLATQSYTLGDWTNTLFMDAYILTAAAALHPTARDLDDVPVTEWTMRTTTVWRRIGMLAVVSVVPGLLMGLAHPWTDGGADVSVLASAAVLTPLLALARAADLVHSLKTVALEAAAARHAAETIVAASPTGIAVTDRFGIVRLWNGAAERASGYRAEDVIGRPAPIFPADDADRAADLVERALGGEPLDRVEIKLIKGGGDVVDTRISTAPLGTKEGEIVALFEDVTTEQRHLRELDELAHRDELTGLPNRRSFEEELARFEDCRGSAAWVLLLDVDNFKSINDAAGHTLGDDVLRELAALLRREFREADFVGRLSGDEFVAVLHGLAPAEAVEVGERALEAAREFRFSVNGNTIDLTLSAGLAPMSDRADAETVFERADDALYEAKSLGKNRLERWTNGLLGDESTREWLPLIKDALTEGRIELFLQPIVPLQSDAPEAYEALCRLRLPNGTIADAGSFIDAAERMALMPAIDRRMLEKAAELIRAGRYDRIFANLSPTSLSSPGLMRWLEQTLATLPLESLGIEITEHAAIARPGQAAASLARLVGAGAIVAIDDFGLGFTSFRELATLPCHIVKIPAELTRWAAVDGVSDAITRSVTTVAHAYGKQVVIEGIETAEADRRARALGIEFGQGWHYGRPAPSERPRLQVVGAA